MIQEYLGIGVDEAKTAKELAEILGCRERDISRMVEMARLEGVPICASCGGGGNKKGYYLAKSHQELEEYTKSLWRRGGNLFKMRRALLKTLEIMKS